MIWLRGGSDDLLVNEIGRYARDLSRGRRRGQFPARRQRGWRLGGFDVREPRNQRNRAEGRGVTLPAQLPTETMVKEYKGPKAFQRDAPRQAEQGWRVIGQTEHRPRQGCLRIIMMGFIFAFIFPPKPLDRRHLRTFSSRPHHRRNRLRSVGNPE